MRPDGKGRNYYKIIHATPKRCSYCYGSEMIKIHEGILGSDWKDMRKFSGTTFDVNIIQVYVPTSEIIEDGIDAF